MKPEEGGEEIPRHENKSRSKIEQKNRIMAENQLAKSNNRNVTDAQKRIAKIINEG
jgi:hypothetical protein